MYTLLIVLLILILVGALPNAGFNTNYGYGPSGLLGLVVVALLIMMLLGRL